MKNIFNPLHSEEILNRMDNLNPQKPHYHTTALNFNRAGV
ncbi:MAG: hypothetical protein K0Q87_3892 [Neobacillus sp.]|jgi:hypothetical protein|nr:hypothetical protein [Neobacillus sp.]